MKPEPPSHEAAPVTDTGDRELLCAAALADVGFNVFPVNGKEPRVRWRDASTRDPNQILVWWTTWPGAGVGIDCGKSGVVVIDLDVKDVDGVAAWKELADGRAPATFYVDTPSGGQHHYFRDPEGAYRNSASEVAPGIDVRGVGGYVVAPGSPGYGWHAEQPVSLDDLPALPDGVIPPSRGRDYGHWRQLDRDALDPRDHAALVELENLGGHDAYAADGYIAVTRPGKPTGASASIGFVGPGIVRVFTPNWPPLKDGRVYTVDDLKDAAATPGGSRTADPRQVRLTIVEAINVQPVTWLWEGRLPVGTVTLLAGREGIGKSTVAYQLVADITRGLLDGAHKGTPRSVIICATEDSWAHTITPRLKAAGADLTRVYRVDVVTPTGEAPLVLPLDVVGLAASVREVDAVMVLFDPIISRLSDQLDTHKDAEVRRGLEPIGAMADELGVVVLGVIHVNKSGSTDALNAVMGSRAFSSVARAVLFCMRDPDSEDGLRLLGQPKNNLGRDDLPTLAFKIETAIAAVVDAQPVYTGRIVWAGEVDKSIREALEDDQDLTVQTAVTEAAMWLEDYLTANGGTARSAEVKKNGRPLGHSERTLVRARKRLQLLVNSSGFPRETWWSLPGTQPEEEQ